MSSSAKPCQALLSEAKSWQTNYPVLSSPPKSCQVHPSPAKFCQALPSPCQTPAKLLPCMAAARVLIFTLIGSWLPRRWRDVTPSVTVSSHNLIHHKYFHNFIEFREFPILNIYLPSIHVKIFRDQKWWYRAKAGVPCLLVKVFKIC